MTKVGLANKSYVRTFVSSTTTHVFSNYQSFAPQHLDPAKVNVAHMLSDTCRRENSLSYC